MFVGVIQVLATPICQSSGASWSKVKTREYQLCPARDCRPEMLLPQCHEGRLTCFTSGCGGVGEGVSGGGGVGEGPSPPMQGQSREYDAALAEQLLPDVLPNAHTPVQEPDPQQLAAVQMPGLVS